MTDTRFSIIGYPYYLKRGKVPLGLKPDMTLYVLNLNNSPATLIAGRTGSGKSWAVSLLAAVADKNVGLFSVEILRRGKLPIEDRKLRDSVSFYDVTNIDDVDDVFERYREIIDDRTRELEDLGFTTATKAREAGHEIEERVLVIDSFEALLENLGSNSDREEDVLSCLENLIYEGNDLGLHVIVTAQDPMSLPTDIMGAFFQVDVPEDVDIFSF